VTLRLVLADDSLLLREGIARLLVEAGFEIAGQAGTPDELLAAVRAHHPDVAIVDIRMPPTLSDEGLRAAEAIRAEHGTAVGISFCRNTSKPPLPFDWWQTVPVAMGYLLRTGSRTSTTLPTPSRIAGWFGHRS
jgi:DNA-binding NarL/FixJ family response regulator